MVHAGIVSREFARAGVTVCRDCRAKNSHARGFADLERRKVHYSAKCETRGTLFTLMHELGHILANTPGMRRWEREKSATDWAMRWFHEHGISIPRKTTQLYRLYENRMKRWGKNIAAGRKGK